MQCNQSVEWGPYEREFTLPALLLLLMWGGVAGRGTVDHFTAGREGVRLKLDEVVRTTVCTGTW